MFTRCKACSASAREQAPTYQSSSLEVCQTQALRSFTGVKVSRLKIRCYKDLHFIVLLDLKKNICIKIYLKHKKNTEWPTSYTVHNIKSMMSTDLVMYYYVHCFNVAPAKDELYNIQYIILIVDSYFVLISKI